MEFNFGNKIDIIAEKSILNEAIIGSQPKVEFNSATATKVEFDFPRSEIMKTPFDGYNGIPLNDSIKSYNTTIDPYSPENMANINSIPTNMNFDISPLSSTDKSISSPFDLNNPLTPSPVVGTPVEFKKIIPTQEVYDQAIKKTKSLDRQLQGDILPTIKKIASHVNDLSVAKTNNNTLTEERPTFAPTNLIFLDRSTKASSPPAWA